MSESELLSINRAAKRLGMEWARVKRMAMSGELPGVYLGGRWYVRNLSTFLDAVQTKPAPQTRRACVEIERNHQRSREEEQRSLGIDPERHPFA